MHNFRTAVLLAALTLVVGPALASTPTSAFIDVETVLHARFGADLAAVPSSEISQAIVQMAERLPVGGAIHLPEAVACGTLDFRRVADDVQITGGRDGTIILGGGQKGMQLLFSQLNQIIDSGVYRPAAARRPILLAAKDFKDIRLFDPKAAPASDLLALFCEGGIHIKQDVDHCAWIAGANAFGRKTVTATAQVNHSLFLCFGINWAFADYNGHFDPKNAGKNWLDNTQLDFDCKGGGEGTRLYLMVETNYGNPGPGVALKDCRDMALYHGSTERSSAQGPGVYWLNNCENVKLGLRRIFSATRQGARSALPAHDITIQGGRGNVLHNIEFFGNAQEESAVNSDPELQAWSNSFDFDTKGFDGPSNLRFCFTENLNRPEGKDAEALQRKLPALIKEKVSVVHGKDDEPTRKRLEKFFTAGHDGWYRLNARDEITFSFGADDLTKDIVRLSNGRKLPPPPSVPATDAPRLRRPIAFTQEKDFGKALLEAGADPTGNRPSDDAFARVMFNMTRKEFQALLETTYQADAAFRAARGEKNEAGMKAAAARWEEALASLGGLSKKEKVDDKNKPRRQNVDRPALHIPAGTFLLEQPLILVAGWKTVWGAGPDKTILKAAGDFKVIEQHSSGTLANFTVDGGKVGLAVTGSDHEDGVCPTLHSYVYGSNYFNITFRNQSFAGIHVGNDDPELMGGSEHDQNRYVDLKFEKTGLYGIFMNQNMLDKWLLLHAQFSGQKKAGISIKFNNLIHGMVVGCKFKEIEGPGIDFMGGNPLIRFRSHQVWVEQCDFEECGSADEPAIDQGAGVCMALTRCNISTKQKTIKTGYRGGAAIYEDIQIDVKTAEGDPAMVLRGVRQNQTGRPNGHMLRNVKTNGPLAFVNDANAYNAMFKKTCEARGVDLNLNWDCNPAAHELAPANGWVHPFVLYHCDLGGKRYEYDLLNVDTDRNKVIKQIDLSKLSQP